MRSLRVIDFDRLPALSTPAVYHGVAAAMGEEDEPVLMLVGPISRYICVEAHQKVEVEVDEAYHEKQGLPVVRSHVGGGAVYLDTGSLLRLEPPAN